MIFLSFVIFLIQSIFVIWFSIPLIMVRFVKSLIGSRSLTWLLSKQKTNNPFKNYRPSNDTILFFLRKRTLMFGKINKNLTHLTIPKLRYNLVTLLEKLVINSGVNLVLIKSISSVTSRNSMLTELTFSVAKFFNLWMLTNLINSFWSVYYSTSTWRM